MSVAISWAKKVQLAMCDISVGFPKSSHIYVCMYVPIYLHELSNSRTSRLELIVALYLHILCVFLVYALVMCIWLDSYTYVRK